MASPLHATTDSVFEEYRNRLAALTEHAGEARAILERRNDRLFGRDAEGLSQDRPETALAPDRPLLTEMDNALNTLSEAVFLLRHQIDRQSPLG